MCEVSEKRSTSESAAKTSLPVTTALLDLARHPAQTFVYSWNWKAALLSVLLRAPIFLIATWHHGRTAISLAVLVEAVYSAAVSGCYGAFVEKLRNARPLWISGLFILIFMPGLLLWLDYELHRISGMPNLKNGMIGAVVLSLLSSLFNWYLMNRGSLLVGQQRRSFASDMKQMPRMLLGFLIYGPRCFYRFFRSSYLRLQA